MILVATEKKLRGFLKIRDRPNIFWLQIKLTSVLLVVNYI